MTDRQEISDLIHLIVDKINVYTRKATKKDKIAGRKKEDQVIPYQVRIDLRLPQDIMQRLAQQGKFEVRNDNLVGRNGVEPFTSFLSGTRSTAEPTTQTNNSTNQTNDIIL